MTVVKLDLERPVQEFEIGGKVYEVGYDDENFKKYLEAFQRIQKEFTKYQKLSAEKLTEKQAFESIEKFRNHLKEMIELYFGEGTFEHVYEACGKYLFNLMEVITLIQKTLNDKMGSAPKEKIEHYLKK